MPPAATTGSSRSIRKNTSSKRDGGDGRRRWTTIPQGPQQLPFSIQFFVKLEFCSQTRRLPAHHRSPLMSFGPRQALSPSQQDIWKMSLGSSARRLIVIVFTCFLRRVRYILHATTNLNYGIAVFWWIGRCRWTLSAVLPYLFLKLLGLYDELISVCLWCILSLLSRCEKSASMPGVDLSLSLVFCLIRFCRQIWSSLKQCSFPQQLISGDSTPMFSDRSEQVATQIQVGHQARSNMWQRFLLLSSKLQVKTAWELHHHTNIQQCQARWHKGSCIASSPNSCCCK